MPANYMVAAFEHERNSLSLFFVVLRVHETDIY